MNKHEKQIQIEKIPKEWKVVRLGNESIAEIRSNRSINKFERVAFIPMDLIPDSGIFIKYEMRPIRDVKSFTYCERGDLLLAKITPSLENGKQGIVPDNIPNDFALATTEVFPISCKGIDRLFLFYVLKFSKFRNKIIASMIGTTGRQRASKESVENLEIPLPPLPEQKKIAEILFTIDQGIEKVDEAIKKTQRLKNGLMQELLTKGIGHKEFKDTERGRIPKEWEVVKLGEIAELERGKFAFRPRNDPRFYGGKFPFIQTGDINETNGIIKKYSQTLNEEGFKISKLFKKGTIVISIAGNIGDVGILDFDSCFPDSIVGIKGDSEKANNLFLMYLLQKFKRELDSIAPRSTQKNINLGILEAFKLPLPPFSEQRKIAEILSGVDERLELLRKRKERLERIKKGLMDDLLTGKKRVKITRLISEEKHMRELEEIKNKIKENMPILRDKYKVKTIGVFGSYIRGEQSRGSDIDILVEFYETIDLFTFIELEEFLSEKVGVKVDLVMKETLKPRIRDTILREAVTV